MLDPKDSYELARWHYVSHQPLSAAQLIARGSADAETVALTWLLLERGASLTVAGPTDPQAGAGKTTTINALLQFLAEGTTITYMEGMYEAFDFTRMPPARRAATWCFSNEVSDHLPIYMWGGVARRYLRLPELGYRVATTVHADTVEEVIRVYRRELVLDAEAVRRLGLIVNIGFAGRPFSSARRWLTVHFIRPQADGDRPLAVTPVPLARWCRASDSFERACASVRAELAAWCELSVPAFDAAIERRAACLRDWASSDEAGPSCLAAAIRQLRRCEQAS